MAADVFLLPPFFDYAATFLWGVSGALVGARRGYDVVGISILALVSATGGGLLRDGLFLHDGPPVLVRTPVYLALVVAATIVVVLFGKRVPRIKGFERLVSLVDGLGLGAYAVVGMNRATTLGFSLPGVILVGMVNAVGGRRAALGTGRSRTASLQTRNIRSRRRTDRMRAVRVADSKRLCRPDDRRLDYDRRRLHHPHRVHYLRRRDQSPAGFRRRMEGTTREAGLGRRNMTPCSRFDYSPSHRDARAERAERFGLREAVLTNAEKARACFGGSLPKQVVNWGLWLPSIHPRRPNDREHQRGRLEPKQSSRRAECAAPVACNAWLIAKPTRIIVYK